MSPESRGTSYLEFMKPGAMETPGGRLEGHVVRSTIVSTREEKIQAMTEIFDALRQSPYINSTYSTKARDHEIAHAVNDWRDGTRGEEQLPGFFMGVVDYSGLFAFVYLMVGSRSTTERLRSVEGPGNGMTKLDRQLAKRIRHEAGI